MQKVSSGSSESFFGIIQSQLDFKPAVSTYNTAFIGIFMLLRCGVIDG